ncbi:MAG TPA: sulfur carrier protein ThiS [Chloroflexota bacterium]|jgi:thiamine biosynthesis protein ThiS|nr:sulfur carrier protein ThiS [Chloroflexota bacterium]
MIHIRLNGKDQELARAMTVQELLERTGKLPRFAVVEVRGEPLPREHYAEVLIEDGDTVEVVAPFGGG